MSGSHWKGPIVTEDGFRVGTKRSSVPLISQFSGDVYYVDSGSGASTNDGTSWAKALTTIDAAVGKCTANNGDEIYVAAGHVETVTAAAGLALDVAGITIVFAGYGSARGYVNFTTAVGADMDVDAADITMVNPRFVAGIDALTGPIDVNAARFKIVNGTWEDADSIDTTDCIVGDASADDCVIDGWTYYAGDEGGTQKQSHIQFAAATRPTLKRIRITGDFGTGNIENGTAWVDALLEDVVIDNTAAGPVVGILLQATSSGTARNVHVRVASGTTYVTANNDMQWFECYGVGTDAAAGDHIGDTPSASIEGKIDTIDEYHDVPAANNVLNAQINEVIGNKTDAAAAGAVTGTDTLVAYIKQIITDLLNVDSATTDNLHGKLGTDTELADRSVYDLINGGGPAAAATAAAPANDVSMYGVLRAIYDRQLGDGTNASTNSRLGKRVTKGAADLLDGVQNALFTVSGGRIMLMSLSGEVSGAAVDGGANATNFISNPTVGTDMNLCATLDIDGDEEGTLYSISGIITDAMTGGSGGGAMAMQRPIILAEGTIDVVSAGDGGAGGAQLSAECWYIPLDDGATVAAA